MEMLNAGCEYEVKCKGFDRRKFIRRCGEPFAVLYHVWSMKNGELSTLTGKQKLCFKHKKLVESGGFVCKIVSERTEDNERLA